MPTRNFRGLPAAILLLALPCAVVSAPVAARAQQPAGGGLEALFGGSGPATPRTLKELSDGGWKHVQITLSGGGKEDAGGGGGGGGLFGAMLGGAMGGAMSSMVEGMTSSVAGPGEGVYYTRGQTISLGPETFLVAVQVQTGSGNTLASLALLAKSDDKPPTPPKPMTGDTPVGLALLNLRSIASITNIKPFDMTAEIAASAARAQSMEELVKSKSGGDSSPNSSGKDEEAAPKKPTAPSKPKAAPKRNGV